MTELEPLLMRGRKTRLSRHVDKGDGPSTARAERPKRPKGESFRVKKPTSYADARETFNSLDELSRSRARGGLPRDAYAKSTGVGRVDVLGGLRRRRRLGP